MNKDLTVGKPESVLWKFCIPLLGSVIFQQLYNIADSLIAGRCIGKQALAAVGNSYEITLIYLAFAFGCNIGCSVVVSRLYGAKQIRDMKTAISTTFIFTGILCLALMLIGFTYGELMLKVINTPDDIFTPSLLYLNIYTLGLVFLFFYKNPTIFKFHISSFYKNLFKFLLSTKNLQTFNFHTSTFYKILTNFYFFIFLLSTRIFLILYFYKNSTNF